jgi:LemA protein
MEPLGVLLVAIVLLYAIASYRRFLAQRSVLANSWSNVDAELRRRHALVTQLAAAVGKEGGDVEDARAAGEAADGERDPAGRRAAEERLSRALQELVKRAERRREIREDPSFVDLETQLILIEDRITGAVRFYNANVGVYNKRVRGVPSAAVAWLAGFSSAPAFSVTPVEVPARTAVPIHNGRL